MLKWASISDAKGVLKILIQLIQNGNLSLDRVAEIAAKEFLNKKEGYGKTWR